MQFSTLPKRPHHCRCTPGVLSPFLAVADSSRMPTVPKWSGGGYDGAVVARGFGAVLLGWVLGLISGLLFLASPSVLYDYRVVVITEALSIIVRICSATSSTRGHCAAKVMSLLPYHLEFLPESAAPG